MTTYVKVINPDEYLVDSSKTIPSLPDDGSKTYCNFKKPKLSLGEIAKKLIRKILTPRSTKKAREFERSYNCFLEAQARYNMYYDENGDRRPHPLIPVVPESGISTATTITSQSDTTATITTAAQPTTTTQPATTTTQPATTTAEDVASGPTTAPQQEGINTSQPDRTAMAQLAVGISLIATALATAHPVTATNTAAQPATTTAQPAPTAAQPATNTAQPSATTAQPAPTAAQPATTTAQPATTTAQPATTNTTPPPVAPSNPPTTEPSSSSPTTQSDDPPQVINDSDSSDSARFNSLEISGYFLDRPVPMIDPSCATVRYIQSPCQTTPKIIYYFSDGWGIPRIESLKGNYSISSVLFNFACEQLRSLAFPKPLFTCEPSHYLEPLAIIGKGVNGYVTSVKLKGDPSHTKFAIKPIEVNSFGRSLQERIRSEVRLMKSNIINVVNLKSIYVHGQCTYLVMEQLECNLRTLLIQSPNYLIPTRTALHIFEQVLNGLHHMHQINYYHGGVRPENILLDRDGQVKLCGFGKSGLMDGKLVKNDNGLDFNAPDKYLNDKSDVWALAVTTRVLFDAFHYCGPSYTQRDIVNANTSIPPSLKAMLLQMLTVNPKDRPSTTDLTDEFRRKVNTGNLCTGTQVDVMLALRNRQYR